MANRLRMSELAVWSLFLGLLISSHAHADAGADLIAASGIQGGIVVHVGCGADASVSTANLHTSDAFLVHGLSSNPRDVRDLRQELHELEMYGPLSVDHWDGKSLPYADNLINLVIVEEGARLAEQEVQRVLAPLGVVMARRDGRWEKTVKPWPTEIDQWTHYLHGADNNAVARDQLAGQPRHVQWIGDPKFARSHEHLASVSAMVSAQGRLFCIIDEGVTADIRMPSRWKLVARDAFNGVVLWKREISTWTDHLHKFRSGPAHLPFRLVAHGDRVYVTLGTDQPVTALEAASGRTIRTYAGSERTQQILYDSDTLVMLVDGDQTATRRTGVLAKKRVLAAAPDTGELVWQKELAADTYLPLVVSGDALLFQTNSSLVCLELKSGKQRWRTDHRVELGRAGSGKASAAWATPTLTSHAAVVYVADFRKLSAFSVASGKRLWEKPSAGGFNTPPDVFIINNQLWRGTSPSRRSADFREGLNPATGQVETRIATGKAWEYPTLAHPRCYRAKATSNFIFTNVSGIESIDIKAGEASLNHWVRGTCQYGIMPCNGMIYVPPHSCACNIKTMMRGLCAYTSSASKADSDPLAARLETGPAYGKVPDQQATNAVADWPMYRHDRQRSGSARTKVPHGLRRVWETSLSGPLSSPVASQGKVFVAAVDAHTVHALDATNGAALWSFTAGSRVDSPPTIHDNMVLFGSSDGWVYCLRESDGELAWRFRAAPEDRRIVSRGQLESPWPVHGSILVHDGALVVSAGRSSYLDGGVYLYKLEPRTGKLLAESVIDSRDPETGRQPDGGVDLRGVLNDILAESGGSIYMRHLKIDFATGDDLAIGPPHLFAPMGYLDDAWWHRSYWLFGSDAVCMPPTNESGWNIWPRVGNMVPSGRILAIGENVVYGYGRNRYPGGGIGQIRGGEAYHLFAMETEAQQPLPSNKKDQHLRYSRSGRALGLPVTPRDKQHGGPKLHRTIWSQQVPIYVRSMLLAESTLVLAGPPELPAARTSRLVLDNPDELEGAFLGRKGAKLLLAAAKDGSLLAETDLEASPVFDGMIAADGRVLVSLENGSLVCYGK